ncbi:MAG: hypothetical protein JWN44_2877 [Myxococcales bacterium]|nr:hypothetical protein [Myxococcales bacterium]
METLIGTSGYSYPKWKGAFYPPKLPAREMLEHYATRFPTVEINNTFYKMPTAKLVQSWSDEVPATFIFAIKAPQRITHQLRLKGAGEATAELLEAIAPLKRKRGPILFQLPPFLQKDVPLLTQFLAELPKGCDAAFEFRHASWFDDETYAALKKGKAALCIAESEKLATPLVATASWGYLRLRREDYVKADIREWAERISAQKWKRAFVYFKHEDEAKGPKYASLLQSLM